MDISTMDYVWHKFYTLNPAMLPPFLSLTLAKKILVVGKSINFLKACSKYSDRLTAAATSATTSKLGNKASVASGPSSAASPSAAAAASSVVDHFAIPTSVLTQHSIQMMSFGNESELEQSIYSIARVIESTLLNIVQHQFHLSVHLSALKKFLLLGQVPHFTPHFTSHTSPLR
jgi:hypothetical protein